MKKYILHHILKRVFLFFFVFMIICLFIGSGNELNILHKLFGLNNDSYYSVYLFIAHLYLIEYLPVCFFLTFFLLGNLIQANNVIFLAQLMGYDLHSKCKRYLIIISTLSTVVLVFYKGFFIPDFLNKELKYLPKNTIKNFFSDPMSFLEKDSLNRIGNYFIKFQKVNETQNGKYTHWSFLDVSIFEINPNINTTLIQKIYRCNRIEIDSDISSYIEFDRCVRLERTSNIVTNNFTSKKMTINRLKKTDIYTTLVKKYNKIDLIDKLPYHIKKYTYSIGFIVDFILNKPCPGGGFTIFEKICYFLAMIIYSSLGYFIAIHFKHIFPFDSKGFVLFIYTLLPMILNIIFTLVQEQKYAWFEITYFLPLLLSIFTYILLWKKKSFLS